LKRNWTNYDSKVSEATNYKDYHLVNASFLPVEVDKVKAYRKIQVKLVLSLLTDMEKCHAQNIPYNDLSPSNIMLHSLRETGEHVHWSL
jgi:serine/threonine protein kinase